MMFLQPLKSVWKDDWTRFWVKAQSRVGIAGSAVLTSISGLNTYVSDPTFKSYLDTISAPKYVIIAVATLGLISWLAQGSKNA